MDNDRLKAFVDKRLERATAALKSAQTDYFQAVQDRMDVYKGFNPSDKCQNAYNNWLGMQPRKTP